MMLHNNSPSATIRPGNRKKDERFLRVLDMAFDAARVAHSGFHKRAGVILVTKCDRK